MLIMFSMCRLLTEPLVVLILPRLPLHKHVRWSKCWIGNKIHVSTIGAFRSHATFLLLYVLILLSLSMACLGGFLRFPETSQNRLGLGLGLLTRHLKHSLNSRSRQIYRLAKRLPSSSRTTSMQDTTRSITQLSGRSIYAT